MEKEICYVEYHFLNDPVVRCSYSSYEKAEKSLKRRGWRREAEFSAHKWWPKRPSWGGTRFATIVELTLLDPRSHPDLGE